MGSLATWDCQLVTRTGRIMIKLALLVCLAALAAAEADAGYYGLGYGGYGGYGYRGYGGYGYGRGFYGRGYLGKRSADAEPEAASEAGVLYGGYGYTIPAYYGYSTLGYYGKRSADSEPEADAGYY